MRRILLSLVTIIAAISLAAGATQAYFMDLEIAGSNSYTTGILDIGAGGSPYTTVEMADNLKPGDKITKKITVRNLNPDLGGSSTLSGKLYFSAPFNSGSELLHNFMKAKITKLQPSLTVIFDGLLKDLKDTDGQEILNPGQSREYELELTLPVEAGPEYQGLTSDFNFEVAATTQGT